MFSVKTLLRNIKTNENGVISRCTMNNHENEIYLQSQKNIYEKKLNDFVKSH